MRRGGNSAKAILKLAGTSALFLGFLLLLFPRLLRAEQAAVPKRILVLYWETKDFLGNVRFEKSFQHGLLSAQPGTVECYSEYLESNLFPGEDQAQALRNYLSQKYARRHIDVVVAVSDVARDFLLKYRSLLFTDAPIVFVGVFRPKPDEIAGGAGATGIFARNEYRATLGLALRLHPGTDQVAVITSTPEWNKALETQCREALQGYENRVSISYLTDLALTELIDKTRNLPQRSVI
jgi:hypothetical protein